MIVLRDYQKDCVESIFKNFFEFFSTLIVVPTGAGKTSIFSEVIRKFLPQRCLVIAHREELIDQAKNRIESIAGIECGIEMADQTAVDHSENRRKCVVATVQTLVNRLSKYDPMDFGLLVCDESHHIVADTYIKILNHFKQNSDLRVLGVTATPDRADKEALGKIFESVAFTYEILDCIQDGWLTPVEQQMVYIGDLDYSHVRSQAGDMSAADLASVLENEKLLQGMVGSAIEIIKDRQTIFFAASVKHAEMVCEIFNRHRSGMAGFVCGKTNSELRKQIMADFSSNKSQVLCNVGIATEGVDLPNASVVVMGRPTKSRSLYSQMAGRAFRPLPGLVDGLPTPDERRSAIASSQKPAALILDYVGNSGRHKLVTTADILGGKVSEEVLEMAKERMKKRGGAVSVVTTIEEIQKELEEENQRRLADEARRIQLKAKVEYKVHNVDPFSKYGVNKEGPNEWQKRSLKALSEKQRSILASKVGVNPDEISISCGKKLIAEYFNHPTPGQAKVLSKYGYSLDCTCKEASAIIDALANNHWVRPPDPEPKEESLFA